VAPRVEVRSGGAPVAGASVIIAGTTSRTDAGGVDGRWTVDRWAPLDGRTINGGVRFSFLSGGRCACEH
jgi:hypothetical protein